MGLSSNAVREDSIRHLLSRLVGRPPRKRIVVPCSLSYRASSWSKPRRVVAKVEWHQGELFPRVGFVVTNLRWSSRRVVRFYHRRRIAEPWMKEGKHALNWTRSSCHHFVDNRVRLQRFVLAYNLGNFLRRLTLPAGVKHWSLTTLSDKLIKIGTKIVRRTRYVKFQMAEVAIPRELFRSILARTRRLADATP